VPSDRVTAPRGSGVSSGKGEQASGS